MIGLSNSLHDAVANTIAADCARAGKFNAAFCPSVVCVFYC
jgi:hypothetical protein